MASTDTTGNATSAADGKANWKMETDGLDFKNAYCDEKNLARYRETMCVGVAMVGMWLAEGACVAAAGYAVTKGGQALDRAAGW